jgi:hypothetical protein
MRVTVSRIAAKNHDEQCREWQIGSDYSTRTRHWGADNEQERAGMKYILLMSGTKADFEGYAHWPEEVLQANMAFMRSLGKELEESGALVAVSGLAFPDEARLVRAGDDGEPVTDGVFPESKEFLAGYLIIDVDGPEEAYKVAARASLAPRPAGFEGNTAVEVRPVLSDDAPEDEL